MAEEIKVKSAEQRASEATFQHLLTFISGKTFARHALLTPEQFLKELGFDENVPEDYAVRLSIANLSNAISSKLLQILNSLKTMRSIAIIRSGKSEEEIMKLIKEREENQDGKN